MTKQIEDDDDMLDEYDIENLNPRPNPYAKKMKQQVTMNIRKDTVAYFKEMAAKTGIPYQTLIGFYLDECMEEKRTLKFSN